MNGFARLLGRTGLCAGIMLVCSVGRAQVTTSIDLAALSDTDLRRVYGSRGDGSLGLPVAGGFDCDGDGLRDYALAAMRASVGLRAGAGLVYLVLGDGTISGPVDTAQLSPNVLRIGGAGRLEAAGSEVWMDDVTGDGLGDLLIARQNFTPSNDRIGAGALTILVGGPELREFADTLSLLDLASPPPELTLLTFVGVREGDRLGIWMRTGDVTGDGVADLVMGADQEDMIEFGRVHSGAVYVVRGGLHLAASGVVDLASFGATPIAGHVARIRPPRTLSDHYHFGATVQVADLDGNHRAEVLVAATLNRAGAAIQPADGAGIATHSIGGAPRGLLYIEWDDNFPEADWPAGFAFHVSEGPGSSSQVQGGAANRSFGEEIVGGLDWDADGRPDLFVGDLVGDGSRNGTRPASGIGNVIYDAAELKGASASMDAVSGNLVTSRIIGGGPGHIAADTAMQGDFDGDGVADLAFSSPHASPLGRTSAGILHVFYGQLGAWPAFIDLAALPDASTLRVSEVYGANATISGDRGDTLSYSGAAGDIDRDGRDDIITNEMVGNGLAPDSVDVGNLIVLGGALISGTLCAEDLTRCNLERALALDALDWCEQGLVDFEGELALCNALVDERDRELARLEAELASARRALAHARAAQAMSQVDARQARSKVARCEEQLQVCHEAPATEGDPRARAARSRSRTASRFWLCRLGLALPLLCGG